MNNDINYLEINNALWNERVAHHVQSDFYDITAFKNGETSLKSIELDLLGGIEGKNLLHLQCHFGQDTLSLARMGARVTGLDFSEKGIEQAGALAEELKIKAAFICSDVYEADKRIRHQADIVYTTYGVLGWLPDLQKWANVVANCLKQGGELILVEFHPVVWMYDTNFERLTYSYFNKEMIIEEEIGTYADTNAAIAMKSVGWNHPVADVITSLIQAGFEITIFQEFDYSPYAAFPKCVEIAPGKYQIEGLEGKMPMVYALKAVKK